MVSGFEQDKDLLGEKELMDVIQSFKGRNQKASLYEKKVNSSMRSKVKSFGKK